MKVLILGLGVSGLAATRLACRKGFEVTVSESKDLSPSVLESLKNLGVARIETDQSIVNPKNYDLILSSPGIPLSHPVVAGALSYNIPVRTEVDFGLSFTESPVIAVTGTNGKSTTCNMLKQAFDYLGIEASLCGNIGVPVCSLPEQVSSWLILEISSYQLEYPNPHLHPKASIFTSFSEDHLSRHGTLENYFNIKWSLSQITTGPLIVSPGFQSAPWADRSLKPATPIKLENLSPPDQMNAGLVVEAMNRLFSRDVTPCLRHYRPLAYRSQNIGTLQGHPVINDSKSTNLESTLAALPDDSKVVLWVGGYDKGESFVRLKEENSKIGLLLCFGPAGLRISQELSGARFPIRYFKSLRSSVSEMISISREQAAPLVFSPGCSSFDEFLNFEDRGQFFTEELQEILDKD